MFGKENTVVHLILQSSVLWPFSFLFCDFFCLSVSFPLVMCIIINIVIYLLYRFVVYKLPKDRNSGFGPLREGSAYMYLTPETAVRFVEYKIHLCTEMYLLLLICMLCYKFFLIFT